MNQVVGVESASSNSTRGLQYTFILCEQCEQNNQYDSMISMLTVTEVMVG